MADYYPLLAKALAGLPSSSTQTSRQAIYDRARKALIGQLRSMRPPLPEEDIAREDAALDAAIARLEGEKGGAPAAGAAAKPAAAPAAPQKPAAPPVRPAAASPPSPAGGPATRPPAGPPTPVPPKGPVSPPSSVRPPAAAAGAVSAPAAAAGLAAKPASPPGAPRYAPPPRPPAPRQAPVAPQRPPAPPPPLPFQAPAIDSPVGVATLERSAAPPPVLGPAHPFAEEGHAPAVAAAPIRPTADSARPSAPGPAQMRQRRPWPWVALILVIAAVCAIAGFALLWKEKPQDLAIKDNSAGANTAKESAPPNKIVERVPTPGDAAATASPPPAGAGQTQPSTAAPPAAAATSAPPAATASPPPAAATNPPTASGGETPIPTVTVPTVAVHPGDAPQNGAQIAAAQPPAATASTPSRAALLIDAGDPQKPKIDLGTALWTLVPPAPGQQAAGPSVQAEIDIPDLKLHAALTIHKNTDPNLPATHTIDLRFTFADGADTKGFKDMALPQMRRDDTPTGDSVSGVRVKINDAYYLVGLTRSDTDLGHNLDLLGGRNWFDFPLLFNDDHVAKLTIEKGATGQSVIAQAIAAWK
ncbi:MAG TPA: hypothetical protein VKS78_18815 [Roseiarcus sp.]|nr:hypothetical protein [Roseiarcus sp.]